MVPTLTHRPLFTASVRGNRRLVLVLRSGALMPPSPSPPPSLPSALLTVIQTSALLPVPLATPGPGLPSFFPPRTAASAPLPASCSPLPRSMLFKMSSDFITPSLKTQVPSRDLLGTPYRHSPAIPPCVPRQLPSCVYSGTRVLKPDEVSEPPLHPPLPRLGLVKITANHSLYKLPTS